MTKDQEWSDYEVILKAETPSAWLISDGEDSDALEAWIPKSQCSVPRNAKIGDAVTMEMPEWLATKKGLNG